MSDIGGPRNKATEFEKFLLGLVAATVAIALLHKIGFF
jgi:hypothetical protein